MFLNNDADDPSPPGRVRRTHAFGEHRTVGRGEAPGLCGGATGRSERTECHGSGRERRSVGRCRRLESSSESDPGVGDAEHQNQYETGNRQQQNRCRPSLAFHRSTRMTAFADMPTPTPPNSGAATRYGSVTRTSARRPTTSGLRTDT